MSVEGTQEQWSTRRTRGLLRSAPTVLLVVAFVGGAGGTLFATIGAPPAPFAPGEPIRAKDLNDRFERLYTELADVQTKLYATTPVFFAQGTPTWAGAPVFPVAQLEAARFTSAMATVDTRQGYNPITGTYVAREAGTYLVTFTFAWRPSAASAGDFYTAAITKNSATVATISKQYNYSTGNYESWLTVSWAGLLATGDAVQAMFGGRSAAAYPIVTTSLLVVRVGN